MALATILKSHKPVSPVFVPVDDNTSVTKKSRQEVDAGDGLLHTKRPQGESHKQNYKMKKQKVAEKIAESKEDQIVTDAKKGKRTIFVGNLPPTCTKKQLVKMFCRFGKIESLRFRCARASKVLPKRTIAKQGWANTAEHSNEMIAYVVFKKEDDVMKSLEANGAVLEDRHIRVDSVEGDSQHKHSHSVFVGNLPFAITNERLREALQQYGEIEATRVVRDKKTGCGKGFGFVQFKEKSGVMFALKQAKSIEIDGRKLRIFKSSENPQKQTKRRKVKKLQKDGTGSKQHKPIKKPEKGKTHQRESKKGRSNKLHRKR